MNQEGLADLPSIALVQMEVAPGRPDINVKRMLGHIEGARQEGATVVVFSEMCVPGYLIGDLWEVDVFVEDCVAYSDDIRRASSGLTVLFGNVALDREAIGEDGRIRKYNAVYVCSDGAWVERGGLPGGLPAGVQPKILQPNYRFFDDDRHFYSLRKLAQAAGRLVEDWLLPFAVEIAGGRFCFGVQLCEDIWCEDYTYNGRILDSLAVYHQGGAQAVFNLSASPWTWQKQDKRNRVVRQIIQRSPLPFFYVNQVGAQNNGKNIIVFDGDTSVYGSSGRIVQRTQPWCQERLLVGKEAMVSAPQSEVAAIYNGVLTGLRHLDYIRGGENRFFAGGQRRHRF